MEKFEPVTQALENWFDKPFAQLPQHLQAVVEEICNSAFFWDAATTDDRRRYAECEDFTNDPATETYRKTKWEYVDKRAEILEAIQRCQDSATPTATDHKNQHDHIQQLQCKLVELDAEYSERLAGFDEKFHLIQGKATAHGTVAKTQKSDISPATPMIPISIARRVARKIETEARHKKWQSEYLRLKALHPEKSDKWIALTIHEGPHAHGRRHETIRKNMKK